MYSYSQSLSPEKNVYFSPFTKNNPVETTVEPIIGYEEIQGKLHDESKTNQSEDPEDPEDPENPSGCKVVKIYRRGVKIEVDCDVYIGYKCAIGWWDLPRSKWANPFLVNQNNPPQEVVDDYYQYIKGTKNFSKGLFHDLYELKGKVLGCWCKKNGDEPCHGDALVRLLNERIIEDRKKDHDERETCLENLTDKKENDKKENDMNISERSKTNLNKLNKLNRKRFNQEVYSS